MTSVQRANYDKSLDFMDSLETDIPKGLFPVVFHSRNWTSGNFEVRFSLENIFAGGYIFRKTDECRISGIDPGHSVDPGNMD